MCPSICPSVFQEASLQEILSLQLNVCIPDPEMKLSHVGEQNGGEENDGGEAGDGEEPDDGEEPTTVAWWPQQV